MSYRFFRTISKLAQGFDKAQGIASGSKTIFDTFEKNEFNDSLINQRKFFLAAHPLKSISPTNNPGSKRRDIDLEPDHERPKSS